MKRALLAGALVLLVSCDIVRGRDATDEHDRSALMRAAAAGDSARVEALLARGARVGQTVRPHSGFRQTVAFLGFMQQLPSRDAGSGWTPAVIARNAGHGAVADMIGGPEDDAALRAAELVHAVAQRDHEVVQRLLDAGADPDARTLSGDPVLAIAVRLRDRAMASRLLAAGADPNVRTPSTSMLATAVQTGDSALVALLLDGGADAAAAGTATAAAAAGLLPLLHQLVAAGADLHEANDAPLRAAAYGGRTDIVRFLIAAGADIDTPDRQGRNALDMAIWRRHRDAARVLIEAGAAVNRGPWTPLMGAAISGDSALVDLLLGAGANPSARDTDGRTPAEIARRAGHASIAERLGG